VVAKLAQATIAADTIKSNLQASKDELVNTERKIVEAEKNLSQVKAIFDQAAAAAQTAVAKAQESKRALDLAYNAWQKSLNAPKIVTTQNISITTPSDEPQTAYAQSALSKFEEEYNSAQRQYGVDKAVADKALKDADEAKVAVDKAKQELRTQSTKKKNLTSSISKLQIDLSQALKVLNQAYNIKVVAVSKYSESANAYAKSNLKLTQVEIDYQSAQAETKALYNKINSQTDQVTALRKLSEFSKASVKSINELLNSIEDDVSKLKNYQIANFLNDKSALPKAVLPVLIITAALAGITYIYGLLRRRRKRSSLKFDESELEKLLKEASRKQKSSKSQTVKKKGTAKKVGSGSGRSKF